MSRDLSRSSRTRVIVFLVVVVVIVTLVVVGDGVFFSPLLIHYCLAIHTEFACLSAGHSQCLGWLLSSPAVCQVTGQCDGDSVCVNVLFCIFIVCLSPSLYQIII